LISGVEAQRVPDRLYGQLGAERFGYEGATALQLLRLYVCRCQDDRETWVIALTVVRQRQAVQRTWHLNIGQHEIDRRAGVQIVKRLVRTSCFHDRKTGVPQVIGDEYTNQRLILHQQDADLFVLNGR
jgi:hypothetical protein